MVSAGAWAGVRLCLCYVLHEGEKGYEDDEFYEVCEVYEGEA